MSQALKKIKDGFFVFAFDFHFCRKEVTGFGSSGNRKSCANRFFDDFHRILIQIQWNFRFVKKSPARCIYLREHAVLKWAHALAKDAKTF